jgi:phage-related protein
LHLEIFEQPASFTGFFSARVLWFFVKHRRIVAVHGIRNKGQAIPARDIQTARERMRDWRKRVDQ